MGREYFHILPFIFIIPPTTNIQAFEELPVQISTSTCHRQLKSSPSAKCWAHQRRGPPQDRQRRIHPQGHRVVAGKVPQRWRREEHCTCVHKTPEGAPVFTPSTALAEEFTELTPRAG